MPTQPDPPEYQPEATWEHGLAAALARVQAQLPRIEKRSKADTGSYTYDYAELADVAAAIMPKLGENGLAFLARPTIIDGRFVLAYSLLHASGEREDGEYPLPEKGTPQQLGGHITYARRYALCAVTGVAPGGEDNDGAGAAEVQMDRPASNGHTPLPEDKPGSAAPKQVSGIQALYKKLAFDPGERDDMLSTTEQIIGHPLTGPRGERTHKNLTYNEALHVTETLSAFEERGDLLAALVEAATP